ncbi:MAG: ECF transporter S component [Solobacterium sp.]|nr:ECF transporter S component [Solobacterium sp.]
MTAIRKEHTASSETRKMILCALLGAIAAVLMSFEISLPFMPAFIKMDLSEVPVILAGLAMGLKYGMIAAVLKVVLKFLFTGTTTMFIGEIVNIIISFLYLVPMRLILRNRKDRKSIVAALASATVICSVCAVFANYFITFPMYAKLFGMSADDILAVFMQFNPLVHNTFGMLVLSLIPFNLIKYGINSTLAYIAERRIGGRIWQ